MSVASKPGSQEGVVPRASAGRSLFTRTATTLDLDPSAIFTLDNVIKVNKFLKMNPLVEELLIRDYPISSIKSMLKCGQSNGKFMKKCACQTQIINMIYRCNLKNCPDCALIRKRRLSNRYFAFLMNCKLDRLNQIYFLTISPRNYKDLTFGMEDVRKKFNKWRKHKYLQERIQGCFYGVEHKPCKDGSWNIHIHCILFGRRLDNQKRGKCLDCGQNLLAFDRDEHKFYCSSSKCGSRNVVEYGEPKLNALWEKSTGEKAHFDIRKIKGDGAFSKVDQVTKVVNYLLKYVVKGEEGFPSIQMEAEYLVAVHGKRMVSSFGSFYKVPVPQINHFGNCCPHCGSCYEYIFDELEIWNFLYKSKIPNLPPDPPPVIEYVVVGH